VASLGYRLSQHAPFPAPIENCDACISGANVLRSATPSLCRGVRRGGHIDQRIELPVEQGPQSGRMIARPGRLREAAHKAEEVFSVGYEAKRVHFQRAAVSPQPVLGAYPSVRRIVYIMLMIGTPGTGKTMLAQRLPTILPPLTPGESLKTTRIQDHSLTWRTGPCRVPAPRRASRPCPEGLPR
jgi:hypothetical protein